MYALVSIKGRQYQVEKDSRIKVDLFSEEEGSKIEFTEVLMIRTKDKVNIGKPYIAGARVMATVEAHGREKKITVFKRKRRKTYRRTKGHRQGFSLLRIQDIVAGT